jgi:RNA-directed DNA polymerase
MKESYRKDLASHPGPESCAGDREVAGEALTGVHAGQPSSCEIRQSGTPTLLSEAEGNIGQGDLASPVSSPAQSKTLGMRENSSLGNQDIPCTPAPDVGAGRSGKAVGQKPDAHIHGKSDGCVVPVKPSNKEGHKPSAEMVEERQPTKGNTPSETVPRTQSRTSASLARLRVREVARQDRRARFTALLHHITVDVLEASFDSLKRTAAPGVDGVTWQQYEENLVGRLTDLHRRIHTGRYQAQPSKRAYIPKADGRLRPLGIAAMEDKIVQQAVVTVLSLIYEEDFQGFSYGFRPRRGAHDALDALWVGLMGKKVNWVLDADIQGFFDTIGQGWLVKFLEYRIADRRILRLIRKWLRAGVSEDGQWSPTKLGAPQGAVISPLLSNVYLHYVFDLWVNQWRTKSARGDVIVVRYADDFVLGFQHRHEAERFLHELQERFVKFGLALHPDKTRLIEFGRFAVRNCRQRGESRPETFDFLGFTHICGKKHESQGFTVKRKTSAKRLRARLRAVKQELLRRRHEPVPAQGAWLQRVLRGYFNYHAVPGNSAALEAFRTQTARSWLAALRRRSQRHRLPWERFTQRVTRWLPRPKILHPYPSERFYAKHPR